MSETKNLYKNLNRLAKFAVSCFPNNYFKKEKISTVYVASLDPIMVTSTVCPSCGRAMTNYQDAEYVREVGICYGCEDARCDAWLDAKYEAEQEMKEMGLDPENPDDVESYMERNQ